MGDSHCWHPGSGALAPHWLLSIRLEADELLSSWIIRAAHKQDASIFRFFSFYSAGGFFGDVDMDVHDDVLSRLAHDAGLSVDAMRMAMLQPHIACMVDEASSSGSITNWILPIGLQPIKRVSGLQFCPMCWQSDTDPYLRINWRLAWHAACPTHRILMIDRCNVCGALVSPHFSRPYGSTMACCTSCMSDLRVSSGMAVSEELLAFQARCDEVLHRGVGEALGRVWPANAWFLLQSMYVSAILRLNRKKPEVLIELLGRSIQRCASMSSGLRFELLRTSERADMLDLLERVQHLSSSDTIKLVKLSGRFPKSLRDRLRAHHDVVSLFQLKLTEVSPVKKRTAGPRPKPAVKAMMSALRKRVSQ